MSRVIAVVAIFAAGLICNGCVTGDSYDHFATGWLAGCIAMAVWFGISAWRMVHSKA